MKLTFLFVCLSAYAQLFVSFALDAHSLSDEYIASINAEQDQWQAGRNFDADTPLSEIKALMGTRLQNREDKRNYLKDFDPEWPLTKDVPKKFDARKKWHKKCPKIAQVVDQGKCGSCWAISAAQAFTDRFCIATRGKRKLRLSTHNVMSCCSRCGDGCEGGWENEAWRYFVEHGLPSGGLYNTSEGCQPYPIKSPCTHYGNSPYEKCPSTREKTPACPEKCTNTKYRKKMTKDYKFATKRYSLPADEKAIMKDIMAHGPVTTAFSVKDDFLSYKSGVYDPTPGSKDVGGHAVKLLGWGEEKGVPYWLIMNSWNEYWGDNGLIKMKRGSPKIGLEHEVWAAEPKTKA